MHLLIAAVGRVKDGPENELASRYVERIDASGRSIAVGPVSVIEIPESRARAAESRKTEEAARLLETARRADRLIGLDERGKPISSRELASLVGRERDGGVGTLGFLIGGPDGHGAQIREQRRPMLSLGPLTLPHALARVVLLEQLYRVVTILSGHPYHRD